jgi:hypothetical protein
MVNNYLKLETIKPSIELIFTYATAIFFFLMLFLPTSFQIQRGILLLVLTLGGILASFLGRWKISRDTFCVWLFTLILSTAGVFWGYIHGAPGALRVITVFIIWPLLYMLFVGLVHSRKTILIFEKTILLAVFFTSMMLIFLLAGAVTGYGDFMRKILAFQGASYGLYSGFSELSSYNMATVIYGLPFLTTLFFLQNTQDWKNQRRLILFLLIIVIFVCIISGRRAFWVTALVTPIISASLLIISGFRIKYNYILYFLLQHLF